jgi:hypothetical protein
MEVVTVDAWGAYDVIITHGVHSVSESRYSFQGSIN